MLRTGVVLAGGVAALLLAGPAVAAENGAQDPPADSGHGVFVFANGGGFSSTTHLNSSGTTRFKLGFNVGGGIGYDINRYLAVRGTFQYIRSKAQDLTATDVSGLNGVPFDRYVFTGELQLGYPFSNGVKVYALAGGGVISLKDTVLAANQAFTRGVGKLGVGISYRVPGTTVSLFAQGNGLVYKWNYLGLDRTQFETTWVGGLAVHFPM